jgi:hypothetical protein
MGMLSCVRYLADGQEESDVNLHCYGIVVGLRPEQCIELMLFEKILAVENHRTPALNGVPGMILCRDERIIIAAASITDHVLVVKAEAFVLSAFPYLLGMDGVYYIVAERHEGLERPVTFIDGDDPFSIYGYSAENPYSPLSVPQFQRKAVEDVEWRRYLALGLHTALARRGTTFSLKMGAFNGTRTQVDLLFLAIMRGGHDKVVSTSAQDTANRQMSGHMDVESTQYGSRTVLKPSRKIVFQDTTLLDGFLGKRWGMSLRVAMGATGPVAGQEARVITSGEEGYISVEHFINDMQFYVT